MTATAAAVAAAAGHGFDRPTGGFAHSAGGLIARRSASETTCPSRRVTVRRLMAAATVALDVAVAGAVGGVSSPRRLVAVPMPAVVGQLGLTAVALVSRRCCRPMSHRPPGWYNGRNGLPWWIDVTPGGRWLGSTTAMRTCGWWAPAPDGDHDEPAPRTRRMTKGKMGDLQEQDP